MAMASAHSRIARASLVAAAASLLAAFGAYAHHSVAGQFDSSKKTQLQGTISDVDWINPHIYIHLDVKNETGAVTAWRLESLPTAMLRKAGLTKEMIISDGMAVTVDAYPARDGSKNVG